RADEAVAGGGLVKGARDGARRLRGADRVVLAHHDAPLLEQLAQRSPEVGILVRRDSDLARQGLGLEWLIALPRHRGEDLLGKVRHNLVSTKDNHAELQGAEA